MFYDIETEMEAYLDYNPDVFRGKTVLLPCDDPEWSNFTKLYDDPCIKDNKNIFEYVLGDCKDTKLLNVRVFDDNIKGCVYRKQTEEAKKNHVSNCPLCAIGQGVNKDKIWLLKEMDADHVEARSKGGATDESNCQMLCKTHNRAKGNR